MLCFEALRKLFFDFAKERKHVAEVWILIAHVIFAKVEWRSGGQKWKFILKGAAQYASDI